MPTITKGEFQTILNKGLEKYFTRKGVVASSWRASEELFNGFIGDVRVAMKIPDKVKFISGNTLLKNYHYQTAPKAKDVLSKKFKDEPFEEGNLQIINTLSDYAFERKFFVKNSTVFDADEGLYAATNNVIEKTGRQILELLEGEDLDRVSNLFLVDKVTILNEENSSCNFFQSREAADIVGLYVAKKFRHGFKQLPPLSITRECSLPYCVKKIIDDFNLGIRLKVLCFEDDADNIKKLEDMGCEVYPIASKDAIDKNGKCTNKLAELDERLIMKYTKNVTGFCVNNKTDFPDDDFTQKNQLYDELLKSGATALYVPYKNGIIFNDLKSRIELKKDVNYIAASKIDGAREKNDVPVQNEEEKNVETATAEFTRIAAKIHGKLGLAQTDLTLAPMAVFLAKAASVTFNPPPQANYVILNAGKSHAMPYASGSKKNEEVTSDSSSGC